MIYFSLIVVLVIIACMLFINIQLYLNHPDHKKFCEEWFARFNENNRERFADPELAWRYGVIEQSFQKSEL